ncbi:MAG: spore coat protein [Ruminococcaceae bacterium]|nr:spore coat protein [Oscillospiraceae bacterium]
MAVITVKELGSIQDQLHLEENLIKKYQTYACETNDTALQNRYNDLAARHQKHYDALYAQLK